MDPENHLLSVTSKMIPSPDWIVGVSMENLCLANCSWVDSRSAQITFERKGKKYLENFC